MNNEQKEIEQSTDLNEAQAKARRMGEELSVEVKKLTSRIFEEYGRE